MDRLKVKGKEIYHENSNQKKVGVVILILQNIDIKTSNIRDKDKYYIMIKNQFFRNVYVSNNRLLIFNMCPKNNFV